MDWKKSWKNNLKVLIIVSGGISAYKVCEVIRALVKAGCEVKTVLTSGGEAFVTPLTLATLSKNKCFTESDFLSNEWGFKIPHIELANWANVIAFIPATASVLSDLSTGNAHRLHGAIALATRSPIILFPAMNNKMYEHPATQKNILKCKEYNYQVVEPDTGELACAEEGKGRLPDTQVILDEIFKMAYPKKILKGKHILITGGPTREFMDAVRFISNPSSGAMGIELARYSMYMGAKEVTLILGPTHLKPPHFVNTIKVTTALEMFEAVKENLPKADIIIKAAAVSDFKPSSYIKDKLKREDKKHLTITLEQNPDIAAYVGKNKKPHQILIGFAAEYKSLEKEALRKIKAKNLDFIVANDISSDKYGFLSSDIRAKLCFRDGKIEDLGIISKEEASQIILSKAFELLNKKEK